MFHTRNCKVLHEFLNKDKYDMEQLHFNLVKTFGRELVDHTQYLLEGRYDKQITNLRQYFALLDALVAELYH